MLRRRTPFPSRSSRQAAARPEPLPKPSHRAHEAHLLEKVREAFYPREEWSFLQQVRNTVGFVCDVIRYADALAIHLLNPAHGWLIHCFELKLSRADFLREIRDPNKSGPLKLFCAAWWIVVPAPWTKILLSLDELPAGAGLIEVGTGGARIVVQAAVRQAEEPVPGFLKAILRKAMERGEELGGEIAGVPLRAVTRIRDRWHVSLECGHIAPRPQTKGSGGLVPCGACAAGLPGDERAITAAIACADPEELQRIDERLKARRRELGLETLCTCEKPGGNAVACLYEQLRKLGLEDDDAQRATGKEPCHCHCHPKAEGGAA